MCNLEKVNEFLEYIISWKSSQK